MLRIILLSQGFNFHTYQYQLQLGPQLTHEQIKKIQDDPLHAIILDDRLSQSIVYSTPQMIAPVFAFQYNYGFILKQCEGLIELSQNAFDFIKSRYGINSAEYRAIKPRADLFFQAVLKHKDMSFRHLPYCNLLYQPKSFFVIYPNFEQTVYTFPAINLKRVIKHLFHRLHHHKQ